MDANPRRYSRFAGTTSLNEAEEVLNTTLERAQSTADELVQAEEILSSLADVSRKQGNRSILSLTRHKMALKHYISLGNARWSARTYNNIGYLLRRRNERSKALKPTVRSKPFSRSSDDNGLIYSQITLARSLNWAGLTEPENMPWHPTRANLATRGQRASRTGSSRAGSILLQSGTV